MGKINFKFYMPLYLLVCQTQPPPSPQRENNAT